MNKRMTLLAKKLDMSTADFRNYWAGPHAKLALGMGGIAHYVHNRVDKVLWTSGEGPIFRVDGIVELYFEDDGAMKGAQASAVGRRHIPADEPNFLMGWTLCLVEAEGEEPPDQDHATKVVVPFLLAPTMAKESLQGSLQAAASHPGVDVPLSLNWTTTSASREGLWSEPKPPTGIAVLWFKSVAAAHCAFDEDGPLRRALEDEVEGATAYLVDALTIR